MNFHLQYAYVCLQEFAGTRLIAISLLCLFSIFDLVRSCNLKFHDIPYAKASSSSILLAAVIRDSALRSIEAEKLIYRNSVRICAECTSYDLRIDISSNITTMAATPLRCCPVQMVSNESSRTNATITAH